MKRAQLGTDAILIVIVIFFLLAMLSFFAVKMFSAINTNVQATDAINAEAKAASANVNTKMPTALDVGFLVGLGILAILLFITSSLIGTNPVWFFINVFIILLLIGGAAIFSNLFSEGTNNATFVNERASMPGMTFVMDNLLLVIIVFVAIGFIGYFAKPFGGQV